MYRTVAQIDSALHILATWFPSFFMRQQLPETSVHGRPVYALRLRAGGGGDRRAVLVIGGTHARELMNPDAIVELAVDLLLSYSNGTNVVYGGKTFQADDVKLILEALDIWLVPCINPDGRDHVMTVDDLWRKNRRVNASSTCIGVDLNRNADMVWGVAQGQTSCSPCSEVYCGAGAFSEPETRNVKYLLDTLRVVSFVDVHSFSELVLYPWGHARAQTTDPSKRFTGLPTHTCTASIPASYAEYMTPVDLRRFQTVAGRIVDDIAAVRSRRYTPEPSVTLYPTTGSQSDYAYGRHIADPARYKTYGFTFETGPSLGDVRESFHPADPEPVKRDAKAAMLSLMQQSVCAIELIGSTLAGGAQVDALRVVRDKMLASTPAGREWIALFERAQFALLATAMRDPRLLADVGALVRLAIRALGEPEAVFAEADAQQARVLLKKMRRATRLRALAADLDAADQRLAQLGGKKVQKAIESLMRRKPAPAATPTKV